MLITKTPNKMEDEKKYKNIVEQEYAFKRKKVLSLDIKMFIEFSNVSSSGRSFQSFWTCNTKSPIAIEVFLDLGWYRKFLEDDLRHLDRLRA